MTKFYLSFFILIASYSLNAQHGVKSPESFISDMELMIPRLMNDFLVPGLAIAIIEDGEVILQKGYGLADVSNEIEIHEATGFNIASISKTVAAWGVMKLVEEGKLELDAPAEQYLTRWKLPDSEYDSKGVTIRRLLSHTAGLSLHGYPGWTPEDQLPTIEESLNGKNNGPGRVEQIMEPGTEYKYSGGGYTILQLVIEEVTGEKFADYMQKQILNPLGMTNSSYLINEAILSASSVEHNSFGEPTHFELFTAEAAAGLHTTIGDFTRFAMASLSLNDGSEVLQKSTIKEMMTAAPAAPDQYGLGYQVQPISETDIVLRGHGGANTGWHSFFRVNPETNDGFIVFTNGGAGHYIYTALFCDWIYWKTGRSMGERCNVLPPFSNQLKSLIDKNGTENLSALYADNQSSYDGTYDFSERSNNELGYHYLFNDEIEKAEAVFKMNMDNYPESFNAYDSYAEVLLKKGDKEGAIVNYRKSVELFPGNQNGINALKELGENVDDLLKELTVSADILEQYTGHYVLPIGLEVDIERGDEGLFANVKGQGTFQLFALSDSEFFLKEVEAKIAFKIGDAGNPTTLTLFQGGGEFTAEKSE